MPCVPAAYRRDPRCRNSCTPVDTPEIPLIAVAVACPAIPVISSTLTLPPVCVMTDTNALPEPSSTIELRYEVQSATHCHPDARVLDVSSHRCSPSPKEAAYRYVPSVARRLPVARGCPRCPGRLLPSNRGGAPSPPALPNDQLSPSSVDTAMPP